MNFGFLLGLLKGKNVFETVAKILVLAAGFLANNDSNKTGNDDLAAGCLLAISDGVDAYGKKDNNEHGNIVDGIISALQRYRSEMVACGQIKDAPATPPAG